MTGTTVVNVASAETFDALFNNFWNTVFSALVGGDKPLALQQLNTSAKAKYDSAFDVLQPDMAEIAAGLSPPQRMSITSDIGEYAVVQTVDGDKQVFLVYFLKGSDGVWKLDSM